jgi:hypothetical protein
MPSDLSLIKVTTKDGVPAKYEWEGESSLCAISDELFAEIYAGLVRDATLNGKMLRVGGFAMVYKERRGDALVFERVDA